MNFSVTAYIAACFLFILLAVLFAKPLRAVFKIVINSVIGIGCIWIFNFVGGLFGAYIGINAFTALTVGILGIPGFASLLVLQLLLK